MMTMESIKLTWASITPQKGQVIARRADPTHPLDFFIGYDEDGAMQLTLVTDVLPDLPPSSQQVQVRPINRKDGKQAVCFSLVNSSLKDTFISLCWDIIDSSRTAENKTVGVEQAVRRFAKWLILLAKGKNAKLSDSAAKGLLGELSVLRDLCIPIYGGAHAVTGWIGPLHADRDFEYEDTWYEVKALSSGSDTVSISSFDQLDIDEPGTLAIVRIDKTADSDSDAISLKSVISDIDTLLAEDSNALSTFHVRLVLCGYSESEEPAEVKYHLYGYEKYKVLDNFPRIRSSMLPKGIEKGEYTLNIPQLAAWAL